MERELFSDKTQGTMLIGFFCNTHIALFSLKHKMRKIPKKEEIMVAHNNTLKKANALK